MALSAEQRAAVNRKNAARSTGPRSESGKGRSRQNALRHGLRAESIGEVVALPGEDPEAVAGRAREWREYYGSDSPAARHLATACARATLMADRLERYHAAVVARQMRSAQANYRQAREDEVARARALLKTDPEAAVRELKRTADGCAWLIERWERLACLMLQAGGWGPEDRDEAIRLQGFSPYDDDLRACPEAWVTSLFAAVADEQAADGEVEWHYDEERLPNVYRSFAKDAAQAKNREAARENLAEIIQDQLGPLREQEARLRETVDAPALAEAPERALVLLDPTAARLYVRYQNESRNAFTSAYRQLLKTLTRDAAEPPVSPNEAIAEPVSEEDITPEDTPADTPGPALADAPAYPNRTGVSEDRDHQPPRERAARVGSEAAMTPGGALWDASPRNEPNAPEFAARADAPAVPRTEPNAERRASGGVVAKAPREGVWDEESVVRDLPGLYVSGASRSCR